jgi:hypothetical protein
MPLTMSHADWMKNTHSLRKHRSQSLIRVDQAVMARNEAQAKLALISWINEQNAKNQDWHKSVRNTKGTVEKLYKQLNILGASPKENVIEAVYLYKILLTNEAAKHGGELRYASQHSLIWSGTFNKLDWLGVCAGLSIEWIKAKIAGGDIVDELLKAKKQAMTGSEDAVFAKQITDSQLQQKNVAKSLQPSLTQQGNSKTSDYPYKNLAKLMKPGCYHYLSSGSHAMAAFYDGSKLDFYDPNVGEVTGTSSKLLGPYLSAAKNASAKVMGVDVKKTRISVMAFSN